MTRRRSSGPEFDIVPEAASMPRAFVTIRDIVSDCHDIRDLRF